jgi:hypothetical protein
MIYEYAIDPELLIDWAQSRLSSRYINDNFGIGKPRLMAEFPKLKKIRKLYLEYVNTHSVDEMTKARLTELYSSLTEKTIKRNHYMYDGEITWLENAEIEDGKKRPFRAIISKNNPRRKSKVLVNDAMGEWPDAFWKVDYSIRLKKHKETLLETLKPLLQSCSELFWIDPYFKPAKSVRLLKMVILEFLSYNKDPSQLTFEIHISMNKGMGTKAFIEEEFNKRISPILPDRMGLTVKCWDTVPGKEKYHDRFFITDIGGIQSSYGFDEDPGEVTTGLNIISKNDYHDIIQNYLYSPVFDLHHQFTVGHLSNGQF